MSEIYAFQGCMSTIDHGQELLFLHRILLDVEFTQQHFNIIKMFHSHIKMYRTLVIWKYASVYIRCLDIVTIVYLYIYHFVYITVIVLYFPFKFCTNNMPLYIMVLYMPLYIMVLPGICRVLFISSFIFFLFLSYNVL